MAVHLTRVLLCATWTIEVNVLLCRLVVALLRTRFADRNPPLERNKWCVFFASSLYLLPALPRGDKWRCLGGQRSSSCVVPARCTASSRSAHIRAYLLLLVC